MEERERGRRKKGRRRDRSLPDCIVAHSAMLFSKQLRNRAAGRQGNGQTVKASMLLIKPKS